MVSQRGILNLFHTDAQRDASIRRGNAMLLNGADADLLTTEQIKNRYPFLNTEDARFPIKGGLAQHRGGTVRHDAVAWGYARSASRLGVDIIQNCEVTGLDIKNNKCIGVTTTRGSIKGGKVACCVAGSSSRVMAMAGIRLPIENLYFNGGWCYGGFKATPASGLCYAHLLATGNPHETATAYRFDRFERGLMIDEKGQGNQPNLH